MTKIVISFLLLVPKEIKFISFNNKTQLLPITITAYSPEPAQTDNTPYITATNTRVGEGIVAVSRSLEKLYPMGLIINIEGKQYLVADRMSKKWKDYRIDIFFWNKKEAIEFGKKEVLVEWSKNEN